MSIHSSSLKLHSVYLAETGQYFYGEDTYGGEQYNGVVERNPVGVITDGIVRVGPVWGAFFAVIGFVVIVLIIVRMRKRSKREKAVSPIPSP